MENHIETSHHSKPLKTLKPTYYVINSLCMYGNNEILMFNLIIVIWCVVKLMGHLAMYEVDILINLRSLSARSLYKQ